MLRIGGKTPPKVGMVKPAPVAVDAGGNTTQQKVLPSLPVPPLQQTCELYLDLLESILEEDELERTQRLVEDFQRPGGVGERLQRGLQKKASSTENWWTDDYIRNEYLMKRKPVVVHSNVGGILPRMNFRGQQGQIKCAAKLIAGLLDLKMMIDSGAVPVDYMHGRPLCMKQYEQVLSTCRIPGPRSDSLVFHGRSSAPPTHITVVHRCQFFMLEVYNSDGTPLTSDQLCVQLQRICSSSQENHIEPVGILTTQHRDVWSKTYSSLIEDETNRESVSTIQSSIITLCLDGAMPPVAEELYRTNALLQVLHGGGSEWNSGNRWFDKAFQVIIGEDGTCGVNSSHASADGTVLMGIGDRVMRLLRKPKTPPPPAPSLATLPLATPQKLHFNITPEIRKDIEDAKKNMDILAQNLDLIVMVFDHFGKNVLKTLKMSPDGFVQLALQLAYYRVNQRCCPTMEPTSLRMFAAGRVCPIHSNSRASAAFVKAFDDPKKQSSEKVELMEKALSAHRWNIKMAVSGQAMEGHLLGLEIQAVQENIPMPGIFTDPSFSKMFSYRMSTSQVSSRSGCLPCVAPEEPNIYDICYSVMNNHIDFIISFYESSPSPREKDVVHLSGAVELALLDMRNLLEQTPRAKL